LFLLQSYPVANITTGEFCATLCRSKTQNTISAEESLQKMQRANPKFILRNYLLFQCIEETDQGDFTLLNKLLKALEKPL
jgi:uncharacterized protein YdiU (UPF0061 family)